MSIDKAAKFLDGIAQKDEIVIVFNDDADGVSSCVLAKKLLQSKSGKKPYIIPQPMPTEKNLIRKIQTTLPTKIIFLDLAMDQQENVIKKLKGICDILIIDHHNVAKDLNSKNVVHYNPRFARKSIYQSASYCTYKICSRLQDFSRHLWIAAVGMIGDYNLEDSQDLVKEIREKYPDIGDKNLYDTELGRIADMISAAKAAKSLSLDRVAEILENAESPEDVLGNEKLLEPYKKIETEMAALLSDAETGSEIHGNLILYEIKSKYNLSSPLSTSLSTKFMDKFVVIYVIINNRVVKVSARNQTGKYNVAGMLQKAARGLNAVAGGHDRAAGATVQAKDWDEFKAKLIELFEQ